MWRLNRYGVVERIFTMRTESNYGVDLSHVPTHKKFCEFCEKHPAMMKVVEKFLTLKNYSPFRDGRFDQWFNEEFYKEFLEDFPTVATEDENNDDNFDGSLDEFAYIMSKFIEYENGVILETKSDKTDTKHCLICNKKNREKTKQLIQSYLNELYDSSNMPKFQAHQFWKVYRSELDEFDKEFIDLDYTHWRLTHPAPVYHERSFYGVNLSHIPTLKTFDKFCKNHPAMYKLIRDIFDLKMFSNNSITEEWFDCKRLKEFIDTYSAMRGASPERQEYISGVAYVIRDLIEAETNIRLRVEIDEHRGQPKYCLVCPENKIEQTEKLIQPYLNELYAPPFIPKFRKYTFSYLTESHRVVEEGDDGYSQYDYDDFESTLDSILGYDNH